MEESEYGDDAEGEDDGGSLGSSRAFEEPALPWAEEQEAVGTEPELRGATATTMSKSYADDFDNTDAYSQYGDDEYDAPDSPQDADLQGQGEGVAEESDYGDDAEGEDVEGDDAYRRSRGSSREIAEPSQETASSPQSETRQASRGADIDDGDGDDADAYSDEYGDEDYELPDSPQERMEEPKTSLQKQDTYELDDAADDAHQGDIAPEDDYEDEEYGGASFAQETQDAFHSPAPAEQEPDVGEAVDARTNSPATGEAGILPLPLSLQQEESEAEPLTARAEDPPAREEESRTAQVASTQEQDEDPPLTARAEDTGGSTCPPGRGEEPPPTSSQNGTGIWGDEDLDAAIAAFQSQDFSQASSLAKKATEHLEVVARGELSGTADFDADNSDSGDLWRTAMDKLAAAHEGAGDAERAEALYLRMLAWREGVEQYEASNYAVSETLFKKSSAYRSVEDATWFLHQLRPQDGHAAAEVVGLLALGEEVAAKAAVAVWTIALRPEHREKLTQCGAVELVAKAIAFHSANSELQAAGCGALKLLCTGHPLAAKNRRLLVSRLGAPESVLAAMRTHSEDIEVWREGCGALRAIAHKNPAGARRIIENGGFTVCMEALEIPDEALSSSASKAIAEMRCASQVGGKMSDAQAENLQAFWENRLREDREVGLRICSDKLREHLLAGNRVVVEALLATLCIFMDDMLRYKFLHVIPTIITCMQALPCHEKIQVPACKILCSMTATSSLGSEHEDGIQRLAKCSGIGPVVQAMKDMPCHAQLQRLALTVLKQFTQGNDVNKTLAVRAGAIPATVTALQRYRQDPELQDQGISALTSLCDTLGRASVATRLGAIEAILGAMKCAGFGEANGRNIELGCIILCMFCDDAKLRRHVQKAGAVSVAKKVINKARNLDLQRWGCELLRCVTQAQ